jgi:hypothetical protein
MRKAASGVRGGQVMHRRVVTKTGSATHLVDIATAQADIVKLTIAELGKGLARDTRIIPSRKHGKHAANTVDSAEDRHSADWRPAIGLKSGHGGDPLQTAHVTGISALFTSDIHAACAKQASQRQGTHAAAAWHMP